MLGVEAWCQFSLARTSFAAAVPGPLKRKSEFRFYRSTFFFNVGFAVIDGNRTIFKGNPLQQMIVIISRSLFFLFRY
jgi:hypothetical protein